MTTIERTWVRVPLVALMLLGPACDGGSPGSLSEQGAAAGQASGSGAAPGGAASTGSNASGATTSGSGTAGDSAAVAGSTSTGNAGNESTPAAAGSSGSNGATGGASGGGGAGVAGAAGGATQGPDVPEPTLVVSSKDSYWVEGTVSESAEAVATLTVDLGTPLQRWHGFGGKFSEQGWEALSHLTDGEREDILRLLFDSQRGIGFDWGRLPIGPDDHALERYSLSSAPGQIDLSRDEQYLIPYVEAAQGFKPDIQFWAIPWTPPPWAKVEDGTSEQGGFDKGRFDVARAQDYADYLVAWVEEYESRGIPIGHIAPQNAPGFGFNYPSCAFGPAVDSTDGVTEYTSEDVSLGPFLLDYLAPTLAEGGHETRLWFGALTNVATFDDYWGSLSDTSAVEGVALQLNQSLTDEMGRIRGEGLLVMQSLHWPGNAPFRPATATSREDADRTNHLPGLAPNNHAYAEETWDFLKYWIDAGVNVYFAGNLVLDSVGYDLDVVRSWPQNALISVDRSDDTYEVTPAYYVFRHVAQFVDLDADVVSISGNALAFRNPDGTVVVVLFNEAEEDVAHVLDVGGTRLDVVVPGRGWATVNW